MEFTVGSRLKRFTCILSEYGPQEWFPWQQQYLFLLLFSSSSLPLTPSSPSFPPEPQLQSCSSGEGTRFRGNQTDGDGSTSGRRQLRHRLYRQGGVSVRQVSINVIIIN